MLVVADGYIQLGDALQGNDRFEEMHQVVRPLHLDMELGVGKTEDNADFILV